MTDERCSKEEVARLAHEIYEREIRGEVEPAEVGRFLALDVESGDYEVADDVLEASDRLTERRPGATPHVMRVGYDAVHSGVRARPRRVEAATAGFSLMGEGAVVWFEAKGYGITEKPRDLDWLVGSFGASVGPWSGSFEGAVLHDELERLLADVESSLGLPEFEIAFAPADPYLEFEARSFEAGQPAAAPKGPGRGAPRGDLVSVEGRLDHEPRLGTELRFDFVSDRARLGNTARGLRHVLATFPDRARRTRGG